MPVIANAAVDDVLGGGGDGVAVLPITDTNGVANGTPPRTPPSEGSFPLRTLRDPQTAMVLGLHLLDFWTNICVCHSIIVASSEEDKAKHEGMPSYQVPPLPVLSLTPYLVQPLPVLSCTL